VHCWLAVVYSIDSCEKLSELKYCRRVMRRVVRVRTQTALCVDSCVDSCSLLVVTSGQSCSLWQL